MRVETFPLLGGEALLQTYFQELSPELSASIQRPCVLICPGGGYLMTSDREAEPVALAFAAQGFQTAVLRYPVAPARYPRALLSLAEAVSWVREHALECRINPAQISVCGFSAGGHLAACLGVNWHQDFLSHTLGQRPEQFRPNRLVLGYPVISSGVFAHLNSFDQLLGHGASHEAREAVSLEKLVTSQTPPTFLWHTVEDQIVPVENSMLFASALRKKHIPFEMHLYTEGVHGLSLANDLTMTADGGAVCPACEGWVDLAAKWLRRPIRAYIHRDDMDAECVEVG